LVSSGSFVGLVAPLCPIGAPRFFDVGIFSVGVLSAFSICLADGGVLGFS